MIVLMTQCIIYKDHNNIKILKIKYVFYSYEMMSDGKEFIFCLITRRNRARLRYHLVVSDDASRKGTKKVPNVPIPRSCKNVSTIK